VDTALTKYSTLRIVHIGRTEEGGKTCGPGFPLQVWIGSRYLSREETLKDNTLGRLFSLISQEALFHADCPKCLGFRKLYRGVGRRWRRNRWVDWTRSAPGCTQLGWWMQTQPPKGTHAKSIWFFSRIPSSSYRPLNPLNTLYQLRSPNKCPPFGFPFFHYIRLPIIVTNQEISPVLKRASASPMFPSASPSSSIPGVRCLTEMVSCFLPAAVSAWHGHIMKSSPLPTSENPIFSISSWRCMTDRVSPWRSKGQLLWTLWRKKK